MLSVFPSRLDLCLGCCHVPARRAQRAFLQINPLHRVGRRHGAAVVVAMSQVQRVPTSCTASLISRWRNSLRSEVIHRIPGAAGALKPPHKDAHLCLAKNESQNWDIHIHSPMPSIRQESVVRKLCMRSRIPRSDIVAARRGRQTPDPDGQEEPCREHEELLRWKDKDLSAALHRHSRSATDAVASSRAFIGQLDRASSLDPPMCESSHISSACDRA